MKDLKNLIYLEELLETTDNALVQQAQSEGKKCIGYTCYHMPEVLLNLDNCFSLRIRAPQTTSIDIATYYMSNYTCEFARSLLERAIEGGYQFLDGLAGVDACGAMNRFYEHIEVLNCNTKEKFFVTNCDIPYKVEDYTVEQLTNQLRNTILKKLHENYGTDISDKALLKAVKEQNELNSIITQIGNYRKLDNPPITGYEFHVLVLASYCCPHYLIIDKLRETLEELKTRKPDPKPWYRARVIIVGSECDDLGITKLLESAGAMVVADRYCYGQFPGREQIKIDENEDILTQIVHHYMATSECARYMSQEKVQQRRDTADRLATEYHADGIVYEQVKFCDFWAFERTLASHVLETEYKWPVLSIDRPYDARNSGQLLTRFQAFVEALEIKRIHNQKGVS